MFSQMLGTEKNARDNHAKCSFKLLHFLCKLTGLAGQFRQKGSAVSGSASCEDFYKGKTRCWYASARSVYSFHDPSLI